MTGVIAQTVRTGVPAAGIVIPGVVFLVSFALTWMLYKHFSRHH